MSLNIQERIVRGASFAGLMIPERIILEMESLRPPQLPDLPPVQTTLDEVLLERLTIQGKAWMWNTRQEILRSYESNLLNEMPRFFASASVAVDSMVNSSFSGYIDPRVAAYLSLPTMATSRWNDLYRELNERLLEEMNILARPFEESSGSSNDLTPAELRRYVGQVATIYSGLQLVKCGSNEFRCRLGQVLDVELAGQFDIKFSGQKNYIDFSLFSYGKDGGLRARLGLELVVGPYGNFYLAQRKQRRDMLININFGLVVFSSISEAIRSVSN